MPGPVRRAAAAIHDTAARRAPDAEQARPAAPAIPLAAPTRPAETPATATRQASPRVTKAVDQYIAEREEKRLAGFDIPKHKPYTRIAGNGEFAGLRTVDGKPLALVKRNDEIEVVAIDDTAVERLKRLAIGARVSIDPTGAITRAKGRSR